MNEDQNRQYRPVSVTLGEFEINAIEAESERLGIYNFSATLRYIVKQYVTKARSEARPAETKEA